MFRKDFSELPKKEVLINPEGKEVPAALVEPRIVLEDAVAEDMLQNAQALRDLEAEYKEKFFAQAEAFLDDVYVSYGARLGGNRGGVTMTNFRQTMRVQVSTADYQTVTPAINAAQALVNEVLDDLMVGANDGLRSIVDNAFVRDEKGKISKERILGLRRLEIDHPKWPDAKKALGDSFTKIGSKKFIRFYVRETPDGAWRQIDLNFSSLEV